MKILHKILASLLVGLVALCTAKAQTQGETVAMTLDECLNFAKTNSINIQKARLAIDNSSAEVLRSKGAFLPSLSASVAQNVNIAPLSENETASGGQYSGSYGIDLSMNLYNGGKDKANLDKSQLNEEVANLGLQQYINSLEVSVTEVYVEILWAIDQIQVAQTSLEIAQKTQTRGKAFLDAGSINEVDYAQLQSSTANYEYALVVAKSNLNNLYVKLKHLLEISQDISLEVIAPMLGDNLKEVTIPTVSEVYNAALEIRPEILSGSLSIETAELDTKIAKAGYLPTVSLTAGTGVSHSSASSFDFSSQLRENFNTSAGLRISVPIFSAYQNKTAVRKAENNQKTAELNLTDAEKNLYQTIETLYNNALTAQAKYNVSDSQLTSAEKSMTLTTQQYELGLKNTIELLSEQDNYNKARQDMIVNKYQFIYNKAILNYYKTNIIEL